MNNFMLILILTLGVVFLKMIWLWTDKAPYKKSVFWWIVRTNIIEFFIMLAQVVSAIYFPIPKSIMSDTFIVFGIVLYIIGFLLAFWSRKVMHNDWGHPGRGNQRLFTSGPFSFSRNPMYVGILCIYFGYALAIRTPFIILRIPLIIYFYKSILQEEKLLEKEFGKEYLLYKKRTPRFLFI